jgi:hypothetical protein
MSATPDRINSTGQIVLESESLENNLRAGNSYTRIFKGSLHLTSQQRLVELGFGAAKVSLDSMGDGNYKLTAYYPWDVTNGSNAEAPATTHELENNMSQVEVWSNKNLRATFLSSFGSQTAANAAINFVVQLINSFISGADGSTAAQTAAEAEITSAYSGGQATLILNAFRGVAYHQVKNSIQFDTVYRKRITAATYNQVQAAFTGAEQIWTTGELESFENIPSNQWFQLPSSYLWLKTKPQVNTVANQKTEVSYSYLAVAEAWALLYTPYGSATLLSF